jgi:hypothetical protein
MFPPQRPISVSCFHSDAAHHSLFSSVKNIKSDLRSSKQSTTCFLLVICLTYSSNPEDGGRIFLWNVAELLPGSWHHIRLYPSRSLLLRTSNPAQISGAISRTKWIHALRRSALLCILALDSGKVRHPSYEVSFAYMDSSRRIADTSRPSRVDPWKIYSLHSFSG